jgi:signal transduction histidine kinase
MEELAGKTVAVVDGSIWDEYLSAQAVNVKLIRVEDLRTAIELTAMSGVCAMATNLASATETIHQLGIANLRVAFSLNRKTAISFGVRKDWPQLVSILNKTLIRMDPAIKENIRKHWMSLEDMPWWRNPSVMRTGLLLLGGFIAVIIFFVTWNRILKHLVDKRTAALEQAQQHLIRAAKMESVGQLAAGVAHEVKNPLAIISMGVEFLIGDDERNETERDVLVDMGDAVQRADRVIQGLLDYSHYSKLERRSGDLNEVIEKSLHLVAHELKKHRIEVDTDLGKLKTVYFDFNRIQQVLINIFMNSIQAMNDGGNLEIISGMHRLVLDEVEFIHGFKVGMEVIKVAVSDTGPGIGKDDSEKIFDPFYTTKEVGKGTGLGLSESRNIMELHNGTLQLKNCNHQGACAVLLMPCDKGEGK